MKRIALLLALSAPLLAAAPDDGMLPSWEVVEIAQTIEGATGDVKRVLESVDLAQWKSGAEVYSQQIVSLESELENLTLSAQALGRRPEKLSVVVDTFLWLDRSSSMIGSLSQGVRRYQSAALADLLDSAQGESLGAIHQLKGYMRQLAVAAESEMAIANDEAQRCRAQLMRAPRRD